MSVRLALALALALAAPAAAHAQGIVSTTLGDVKGAVQDGAAAYLGIPYAAPPVGANRWREPQPATPWQGVRDASHYGPACQQGVPAAWGPYTDEFLSTGPLSEDCLTLNVWKPRKPAAKLPVLVFIHGGGFGGGSGTMPIYAGAKLAAQGAVVVTINYRVGVLGFLAHPALTAESPMGSSGNYGLLDQIAALQWVKANAVRFGGDPANIAVSGESAGAASVADLMISPLTKGLFAKAIAFSGASMAIDVPPLATNEQVGKDLAAKLGAATLADLRDVPAETLIEATRYVPGSGPPRLLFVPNVDGKVVPFDPARASGPVVSPVPLISGYNSAEMIDLSVRTPAALEAALRARYGAFADRLLTLYPHGTDAEAAASNALIARDRYMAGLLLWSKERTRSARQRVFAYLYDHPYPVAKGGISWGTFHSSQLPYVFGNLGLGPRTFTAADTAISRQWQRRLLAFLRTGTPGWDAVGKATTLVMGLGDREAPRPAVSSAARLEAFKAYAESGGKLGLM